MILCKYMAVLIMCDYEAYKLHLDYMDIALQRFPDAIHVGRVSPHTEYIHRPP